MNFKHIDQYLSASGGYTLDAFLVCPIVDNRSASFMGFLAMALLALQVSATVVEGPVVPIGVVAEVMLRLEQFSL